MSASMQAGIARVPAQPLAAQQPTPQSSYVRYPFWFGGSASSAAACVTHPLDLIKVQFQTRASTAPKSLTSSIGNIYKSSGMLGFYSGISASLVRQLTYSTARFAIYEEIKHHVAPNPGILLLIAAAAASGFAGGIVGNFADVLNVRMQNDSSIPTQQRRNYKHVFDGLIQMTREEGVPSWFRGWLANSSRAAVQTAGQLASYDELKKLLVGQGIAADTLGTQISASFLAGAIAATVTNPVDVVKTRLMASSTKQGIWAITKQLAREDGARWVFKGWLPSFLRIGPHTVCIFVFLELHRKAYRDMRGLM